MLQSRLFSYAGDCKTQVVQLEEELEEEFYNV